MRSYGVLFASLVMGASSTLFGGFSEMGQRLPADTNSIVAINFDALMQTPLAQKEDWPARWTGMYEAGPLSIPPGTRSVLSGSHLLHDLERNKWQITFMQMREQVPMQEIARNETGTTEKLWNKPAVVSPRGAYFIALEDDLLASFTGGDRQTVLAWVRDERPAGPSSPFIKQAIAALGAGNQIVLALDVQDQFSPEEIRQGLEANPLKATGNEKVNTELLGQVLASVQNISAQIEVAEAPQAKVAVSFGMGVAMMEPYAKPLMMEIMSRNGFAMPEVKDWKVELSENQVLLSGEMARPSLRNVLGFITGPMPAYADAKGAQATDDPAAIGKASQAYFRSISAILDNYSGQASYAEASGWLRKEAQRIERMSVLNVDPELATWGAAVGSTMREAAAMLKGDQMTGVAAAKNVSAVGGSSYGGDGYYGGGYYGNQGYYGGGGYSNRGANVDAQRQKSQVFTQQKAESMKKATEMLTGLIQERSQLRVKMTEKYKVAF